MCLEIAQRPSKPVRAGEPLVATMKVVGLLAIVVLLAGSGTTLGQDGTVASAAAAPAALTTDGAAAPF